MNTRSGPILGRLDLMVPPEDRVLSYYVMIKYEGKDLDLLSAVIISLPEFSIVHGGVNELLGSQLGWYGPPSLVWCILDTRRYPL